MNFPFFKLPVPHNKKQKKAYDKLERQVSHHMSFSDNIIVIINMIFLAISGVAIFKLISLHNIVPNFIVLILSGTIVFLTYHHLIINMLSKIDNSDKKKGGKK